MTEQLDKLEDLVSSLKEKFARYQDQASGTKSYQEIRKGLQNVKKVAQDARVVILEDFKKRLADRRKR